MTKLFDEFADRVGLTWTFIFLQLFNVVAGALNGWFLVANIRNGSWWATVSASALIVILACFIFNWRSMVRNRRLMQFYDEQARHHVVAFSQLLLIRDPRVELAGCYQTGRCPDCGELTLDKEKMICTNTTCGSRFTISPTGVWDRQ